CSGRPGRRWGPVRSRRGRTWGFLGRRRRGFLPLQIGKLVLQEQEQRMLQLGRLESERAAPALVGDPAAMIEEVEAAGHAAVTGADDVVDGVDQHGHTQLEATAARLGYLDA